MSPQFCVACFVVGMAINHIWNVIPTVEPKKKEGIIKRFKKAMDEPVNSVVVDIDKILNTRPLPFKINI